MWTMSDLLFEITESKTAGAIRWQKRALAAEAELAAEGGRSLVKMTSDRNQFRDRSSELEARVAELELTLDGRDRAMQKIIERNMELQEKLPDQSGEGGS